MSPPGDAVLAALPVRPGSRPRQPAATICQNSGSRSVLDGAAGQRWCPSGGASLLPPINDYLALQRRSTMLTVAIYWRLL